MSALLEKLLADTEPRRFKDKILLVDDDPAIRQTLSRLLSEEGYNVTTARTAAEALHFSAREDFDLVLLDLKMPGMDGWDAYKLFTTRNPLLPIIIITARPNQRFTVQAAGLGALMEKPLDLEKLLPTIRSLLEEPEEIRLARMEGRLTDFHYIPPAE